MLLSFQYSFFLHFSSLNDVLTFSVGFEQRLYQKLLKGQQYRYSKEIVIREIFLQWFSISWNYNTWKNISFPVSENYFIYLMTPVNCTGEQINVILGYISIFNDQSMKNPVKLNSFFLKFFCYITWFDETRYWIL